MAKLKRQDARVSITRPGVVSSPGLQAAAAGQRADAEFWGSVATSGVMIRDEAFRQGRDQAARRAADDAANTVMARHQLEFDLVADGNTIVHRSESGAILPTLPQADSLSVYDRVYRDAVLANYIRDVETQAQTTLNTFAEENRNDPARFNSLATSYREQLVGAVEPVVQGRVDNLISGYASQIFGGLQQNKAAREYEAAIAGVGAERDRLRGELRAQLIDGKTLHFEDANGTRQRNPGMVDIMARYLDATRRGLRLVGQDDQPELFEAEWRALQRDVAVYQVMGQLAGAKSSNVFEVQSTDLLERVAKGNVKVEIPVLNEKGVIEYQDMALGQLMTPEERTQAARLMGQGASFTLQAMRAVEGYQDDMATDTMARFMVDALAKIEQGQPIDYNVIGRVQKRASPANARAFAELGWKMMQMEQREIARASNERYIATSLESHRPQLESVLETVAEPGHALAHMYDLTTLALDSDETLAARARAAEEVLTTWGQYHRGLNKGLKAQKGFADFALQARGGVSPVDHPSKSEMAAGDLWLADRLNAPVTSGVWTGPNKYGPDTIDQALAITGGFMTKSMADDLNSAILSADPEVVLNGLALWDKLRTTAAYQGGENLSQALGGSLHSAYTFLRNQNRIQGAIDEVAMEKAGHIYQENVAVREAFQKLSPEQRTTIREEVRERLTASGGFFSFFAPDVDTPPDLEELLVRNVAQTLAYSNMLNAEDSEIEEMVQGQMARLEANTPWRRSMISAGVGPWRPGNAVWTEGSLASRFPNHITNLKTEAAFGRFLDDKLRDDILSAPDHNEILATQFIEPGEPPFRLGQEIRLRMRPGTEEWWVDRRSLSGATAHVYRRVPGEPDDYEPIVISAQQMAAWLDEWGTKDTLEKLREDRVIGLQGRELLSPVGP